MKTMLRFTKLAMAVMVVASSLTAHAAAQSPVFSFAIVPTGEANPRDFIAVDVLPNQRLVFKDCHANTSSNLRNAQLECALIGRENGYSQVSINEQITKIERYEAARLVVAGAVGVITAVAGIALVNNKLPLSAGDTTNVVPFFRAAGFAVFGVATGAAAGGVTYYYLLDAGNADKLAALRAASVGPDSLGLVKAKVASYLDLLNGLTKVLGGIK